MKGLRKYSVNCKIKRVIGMAYSLALAAQHCNKMGSANQLEKLSQFVSVIVDISKKQHERGQRSIPLKK